MSSFLGSLIPNLMLNFKNPKWQFEYIFDRNYQKCSDLDKTDNTQVSGVTDFKSDVEFSKLKMSNPIWWTKIIKNVEN